MPGTPLAARALDRPALVVPSHDDAVVAGAAGLLGGAPGRHALLGQQRWLTPLRVLLALTVLTCLAAYGQKVQCRDTRNWSHEYQYTRACYSDVVALYAAEGLSSRQVPYADHPVEYPVLIGVAMEGASLLAHPASPSRLVDGRYTLDARTARFFDWTALLLAAAACVVVACTARTAGPRVWDAALVALAPTLVLHAYTNWDLLAVAFASGGLLAWSRRAPRLAGLLLGLGAATKAYPLLLLLPLLFLGMRTGRLRDWVRAAVCALLGLLAVYAPAYLTAGYFGPGGARGDGLPDVLAHGGGLWSALAPHHGRATNAVLRFLDLNQQRVADWDSLASALQWVAGNYRGADIVALAVVILVALTAGAFWLVPGTARWRLWTVATGTLAVVAVVVVGPRTISGIHDRQTIGVPALNTVTALLFVLLTAAIGVLTLRAPRRPRVASVALLVVAAFLLSNKVDSPQYVLWLLPLVALARPRWGAFLVWQASEAVVLLTRYLFFVDNDTGGRAGINQGQFLLAVVIRDVVLLVLCALVVREMLSPEHDTVRTSTGLDDPAGGVFDHAPDARGLPAWLTPAGRSG